MWSECSSSAVLSSGVRHLSFASSVVFDVACSASDLARACRPVAPGAPGSMVSIRWDLDIAGGPLGQAGVDERASAARLGLLRYPAAVLGRLNDNIAEVRHTLIELNDLRPDLADHGHLVVYQ